MAPAQSRRILVLVDPARAWRWQAWVAEGLASRGGLDVRVRFTQESRALPASVSLLLQLERLLYGGGGERASELLSRPEFLAAAGTGEASQEPHDLVLDLAGDARSLPRGARVLTPCFGGVAGDLGAIDALFDRRPLALGLADSRRGEGEEVAFGTCASEDPRVLGRGLDSAFSRMADLLVASVPRFAVPGDTAQGEGRAPVAPAHRGTAAAAALNFLAAGVARKGAARLERLVRKAPRWTVAWRWMKDGAAPETMPGMEPEHFVRLKDDGRRYFADPCVVYRDGVHYVFCEEYPFATMKGIVSVFTLAPDGTVSGPRPVLERDYHLSYPFVFEHAGEVWMIPETSANRTVELYRADPFPDRWVREAVLLDGVLADDTTLIEHGGRLWLFAAIREWQGSSWDALGLFHATRLSGEWSAHPANPVLLDPGAARPGGAMFRREGVLWRPAQDCSTHYGGGLALCRVDRLDPEGYAQSVQRRIAPSGMPGVLGLHTFNRAHGLEVIDLLAR